MQHIFRNSGYLASDKIAYFEISDTCDCHNGPQQRQIMVWQNISSLASLTETI
jgi:hypothetical protein